MTGYDLSLIKEICSNVSIPVIACGGAGNLSHMSELVKNTNVSAVAGGSIFSFYNSRAPSDISTPVTSA